MVFGLVNPIEEAVRNEKKLDRDFFKEYSIIPYYGEQEEGSHFMLQIISDLTALSPSHTACKEAISTWSFGSGVDIIPRRTARKKEDAENLLSEEDKDQFEEYLDSIGIGLFEVIELTKVLFASLKDSGNAYLLIRLSRVGSTWNVKFEPVHYQNAGIMRSKSGRANRVITSEYWTEDYFSKKRPFIAFKSSLKGDFVWNEKRNGTVYETILHIKRKADASPYYGRPAILSVLESMYVEHAGMEKDCKVGSSELVAKGIIAMEEPPVNRMVKPHESKNNKVYQSEVQIQAGIVRRLLTNEGSEAKSIGLMNYPNGGNPPEWIPLELNRDTNFDKHMVEKHSSYIYAAWEWDKQLTGFSPVKSNIGGNVLIDLFTVKDLSVIRPEQRYWENAWAKVFHEIFKFTSPNQTRATIQFPNLIEELVDKLSSLKSGSQTDLENGTEDNPTAE